MTQIDIIANATITCSNIMWRLPLFTLNYLDLGAIVMPASPTHVLPLPLQFDMSVSILCDEKQKCIVNNYPHKNKTPIFIDINRS